MNREHETQKLQAHAQKAWETFCEIYPRLVRFDCPKIVLNGRFSRTGGMCYFTINKIDISLKFYIFNPNIIINDTLIHELAHQVDYNLNGEKGMKVLGGHGENWQKIMSDYGLPANRFHFMTIPNMKLSEMLQYAK